MGRYVEEAERLLLGRRERRPVGPGRLQEPERAHDVRIDEVAGAVDRAVHVALGGEVDDRPNLVLGQEPFDEAAVGDVAADEDVPRVVGQAVEIADVARVGELVEVHDPLTGGGEPVDHEVGADEAGAAGDENHGVTGG